MEEVLYLVHHTDKNPAEWEEKVLRTTPTCSDAGGGQFPGVFMTLVTKKNRLKAGYYPGKYAVILSKELLQQNNYHINLMDCNGMITEKITYYPWNLEEAISLIDEEKYGNRNEVVFHDDIDLTKYRCAIVDTYVKDLPNKSMRTSSRPDKKALPFYCYTNEGDYDGVPAPPKSSLAWFRLLLTVANVKTIPKTKKECIIMLKRKAPTLCRHREKQRLDILKEHTLGRSHRMSSTRKNKKR